MSTFAARRLKRAVATLCVGAIALAGVVGLGAAPAQAATAAPQSGLIGEYLFTQTAGSSVANTATGTGAVGGATVVNGTDANWTGNSLVFAGGSKTSSTGNWVRLPDNVLSGRESATITVETKFDATMASNCNRLWNIGNENTTQYYFASVRDVSRTAITTASGGGEVNARATGPLVAGRWYSLTSVIDGAADTISYYIDGAKVATASTTLTPGSITSQTMNTIGRSPWPDPLYKGEVSAFRIYDRALTGSEVADVSSVDAQAHAGTFASQAQSIVDALAPVTIDDSSTTLPTSGGTVRWSSADPSLTVAADGTTVRALQPTAASVTTALTATATVRGITASRSVPVTIEPLASASDDYGYMMVHFIEDAQGYAEKIYLDVSRGDDPEKWDPLNAGKPILASDLGTTGVRDPYLAYNPETETYYIIATDLRVFGGDSGSGSCTTWCYWGSKGSTKLNVWESKDLVSWSDLRQFDVALGANGQKAAELGMAWAPEATWVPDYDGAGKGAFVLYWSSNVYADASHTGSTYSRILWGATTDFSQASYSYGGVFVDDGGNTIDTTIAQEDGSTYRITKDNSQGKGIYMERTSASQWWLPSATWTRLQTRIGAVWAGGNAGGVEGPAVFPSHSDDTWYLYVDVIPSTGYRPMSTQDLDAGWTQLTDPGFSMAPSTKHGGIVSLTKAQYDTVRSADAASAVTSALGTAEVAAGSDSTAIRAALPATAAVTLAYGRGTANRPVNWDLSSVNASAPGTYTVNGTVDTIGENRNQWVGAGGSTAYTAPDKKLSSSTAIAVTAQLVVTQARQLSMTLTSSTRCIGGKVYVTTIAKNTDSVSASITTETAYGAKSFPSTSPGMSASLAQATRATSIAAGVASSTATATIDGAVVTRTLTAPYPATTC